MLLHTFPSYHVTSEMVKTACWGSSSDEETPRFRFPPELNPNGRLRAGGSKFKMTTLRRKTQTSSKSLKRSSVGEHCEQPSKNKETKPKTFSKLKKKLSSARHAMFNQKKRKCLHAINTAHTEMICHERNVDTLPVLNSASTLKQEQSFAFMSHVKLQSNKSLLIPDLNLKPIEKSNVTQIDEIFNNEVNLTKDIAESDSDGSYRHQESQYETALNNSVIVNSVAVERRPEKCVRFKTVDLKSIGPSVWENGINKSVLHRRDISLPLIPGKPFAKKLRESKTTYLLSSQQLPQNNRNQISTKYDASMYDFKRNKSKVSYSNLAKSSTKFTKNSQTIETVHPEGYGTIQAEPVEIMVSSELQSTCNSQPPTEGVKCLFKNRFGQGDQHSTMSWMERLRFRNIEERECLLEAKATAASSFTCVQITQEQENNATHHEHFEKPAQRFYVLLMFCAVTCMQAIASNFSNSITDSILFAYPNSTPKSVALLSHWGSFCLLVCILPVCYLLHKKGLRVSILLACGLCTLGAGIRCFPLGPDRFIFMAHIGSIMNSIGGVVYGPAVVMVSSTWFPTDERTFATGVGTSLSLLGSAATYYLGPLMVSDPATFTTNPEHIRQLIQHEILYYMTLCFFAELCLLILLITSFPNKPRYPTSKASSASVSLNLSCLESVKLIMKNVPLTLLSISSALMNGASAPWLSVLSMTLTQLNISQSIAANIGFWTMICGCVLSLLVSKLSDRFPGYIKQNLATFASLSTVMFTWVALMIGHILPYSQGKLLAAILIGISSSWATSALFYELGAEIAYPVPESMVAGYISLVTSLAVATVNAYVYFFSSVDIAWLSYELVLFSLSSVLSLLFVNVAYNRTKMDQSGD